MYVYIYTTLTSSCSGRGEVSTAQSTSTNMQHRSDRCAKCKGTEKREKVDNVPEGVLDVLKSSAVRVRKKQNKHMLQNSSQHTLYLLHFPFRWISTRESGQIPPLNEDIDRTFHDRRMLSRHGTCRGPVCVSFMYITMHGTIFFFVRAFLLRIESEFNDAPSLVKPTHGRNRKEPTMHARVHFFGIRPNRRDPREKTIFCVFLRYDQAARRPK